MKRIRVSNLMIGNPIAVPVDQVRPDVTVDAFHHTSPSSVRATFRENEFLAGLHGHGVGLGPGRWGGLKSRPRVDGAQAAIQPRTHPRDVVADGLNLAAGIVGWSMAGWCHRPTGRRR